MKITKSGFYKLSELVPHFTKDGLGVVVEDNISAIFFNDLEISVDFELGENSNVEIFGILQNTSDYNLDIILNKESSSLKIRYLLLAGDGEKAIAKIQSNQKANNTKVDMKIISLVMDNGFIDLDGIININRGIEKVKGHLIQENIFLGSFGKIKGIPTLLVKSNDVEASHACKIERISDDELFYLRSRGVEKNNAIAMMIEAKISDLFKCLIMVDKEFYNVIIEGILKKIYK